MALDYARVVLALLASLAVGLGVIWLLARRGIGLGRPNATPGSRIEVLEVRALGGRNALVALRWQGREALVVMGPGHAHTVMQHEAAGPREAAP